MAFKLNFPIGTVLCLTSRQPSNAGGFRRLAFTKPANNVGKEKKQQVNPAFAAAGDPLAVILGDSANPKISARNKQ
jgi:hypothetical protein